MFASGLSDFPSPLQIVMTQAKSGLVLNVKSAGCGILEKVLLFAFLLYEWHGDTHGSSRNRKLKSNTAPDGTRLLK